MLPLYATVEDVKAAADVADSARADAQILRLLGGASRRVETVCRGRRFYPETDTRYVAWPDEQQGSSYRLWLDTSTELLSLLAATSGGDTVDLDDVLLEPQALGPPYTRLELNLATSTAWTSGDTAQRNIALTGDFGASSDTESAGTLAASAGSSDTTLAVTDGATIGTGSLLLIGSERIQVTGRRMRNTSVTLTASITSGKADTALAVSDGSGFAVGETLLIGAERMLIVDIAGNTLVVRRGFDGSVLAAHSSSAAVYALRTLVVTRGVLGTAAASHSSGAAVSRYTPPSLVRELTIAETLNALQQETSAYARTVGSGDAVRSASGRGLADLRDQVRRAHRPKGRIGAA